MSVKIIKDKTYSFDGTNGVPLKKGGTFTGSRADEALAIKLGFAEEIKPEVKPEIKKEKTAKKTETKKPAGKKSTQNL